jgi:hypothetical protein
MKILLPNYTILDELVNELMPLSSGCVLNITEVIQEYTALVARLSSANTKLPKKDCSK